MGISTAPAKKTSAPLHDLAGNRRLLVEAVDGAQAVVAVGDDDAAIGGVAHEEDGGKLLAVEDLLPVFFHEVVADAEERQSRRAEDVLRLERRHGGGLQALHVPGGGLRIEDE